MTIIQEEIMNNIILDYNNGNSPDKLSKIYTDYSPYIIRENLKYYSKKMTFGEIMNASINQTLARSINTSLTTLITLLALYFLGGVTTRDFVLAMILGIAIGTYSSIFFCSTLVDVWEDNKKSAKVAA